MTQNFKPGDRVRVAPHITVKHLTIICIDMIENQQSILNGVGTVTSDNVEWARVDYGGRKCTSGGTIGWWTRAST